MNDKEIDEQVLRYLDFLITGFETYDPRNSRDLIEQIDREVRRREQELREKSLTLKRGN